MKSSMQEFFLSILKKSLSCKQFLKIKSEIF